MNAEKINRIYSISLMVEGIFGLITGFSGILEYELSAVFKVVLLIFALAALPPLIYSAVMKIKHKI